MKETSGRYPWGDDVSANCAEVRKAVSYCIKHAHTYGFVDVGEGAELEIGVSRENLDKAVYNLVHNVFGYTLETVTAKSMSDPEDKVVSKILKYEKDFEWNNEGFTDGKMYVMGCLHHKLPEVLFVTHFKDMAVEYFHKYKGQIKDLSWIEVPILDDHPWSTEKYNPLTDDVKE